MCTVLSIPENMQENQRIIRNFKNHIMENSKKVAKTIRMTAEVNDKFETAFEESNFDSKGEFIESLIDKGNNDEPTVEIEEIEIEVEKKLNPNQLLITLTPPQMFALHEHVTRTPDFAQNQNLLIGKLEKKPWWASSEIYCPALRDLWVRNIELTEKMDESEKEEAIKHNMSAFMLNMFFSHLVNGDIPNANVCAEDIKAFVLDQSKIENPVENENV